MQHRKIVKFMALTLFVLFTMSMFFSDAMAANKKNVFTLKVDNGILTLYQNGVTIDPAYPLQLTQQVRLSAKNGRLVVSFTSSNGKIINLNIGNAETDVFKIQRDIPTLSLDESLGDIAVTIDAKTKIENLNVGNDGVLTIYGSIGQLMTTGASTLKCKSRSTIRNLTIYGGAIVTADKNAFIAKAVRYRNGGGLPRTPTPNSTPMPNATPTPTSSGEANPQTVRAQSISVSCYREKPIVMLDGTMQMGVYFEPFDTTDRTIEWSVSNITGSATIDQSGLLHPTSVGTVTVMATHPASGLRSNITMVIVQPGRIVPTGIWVTNTDQCHGYTVRFSLADATTSNIVVLYIDLYSGSELIGMVRTGTISSTQPNLTDITVPVYGFGTLPPGGDTWYYSGVNLEKGPLTKVTIEAYFRNDDSLRQAEINSVSGDLSVLFP